MAVDRPKQSFIYVADSLIHGKGLFARKHIGAGELIGVLDGVTTSTDGEHVLWLDEGNGFHVRCELSSYSSATFLVLASRKFRALNWIL